MVVMLLISDSGSLNFVLWLWLVEVVLMISLKLFRLCRLF